MVDDVYQSWGAKGAIFEGETHVPLVVAGPDVAAGRTSALVNSTDLHATIASLVGAVTFAEDAIDFSRDRLFIGTERRG